jgi:DNA-binding response OmpR family regulator
MAHTILLCDDELPILRAAEIKFRRAGFEVRTSADGQEAWEAMQAELPDLVVTDCQMPRMNGLELVQKIREDARTSQVPVIMLTARGFELSKDDLESLLGIRKLIGKPFSPRELLACAQEILGATAATP